MNVHSILGTTAITIFSNMVSLGSRKKYLYAQYFSKENAFRVFTEPHTNIKQF